MKGKLRLIIAISLSAIVIIMSFLITNKSIETFNSSKKHPIYSVDKSEKVAAVTFDVNWAEKDYLYSILDTLDKYNVKGTFFIMGGWVDYSEENVKKLKDIKERGHEIGNHSYKHPQFSTISKEKISEELKKTSDVIEKYTNERPTLMRFPSGDYNDKAVSAVTKEGYIPIQWDTDSVDWKELGLDIEYKRVKNNLKPGSIILFHNNAKYTNENLDRILNEFISEGYKFITAGELIYKEDYSINDNGVQYLKNK